ncbi:SMP-30/gluconolactonase/LRE family protein [Kitasatospora sp. NBC_01287]|uniref:SMP-30/gluconolactonase/LRE family protein n=1 Tax=Kitasatospora sp. NBC_01287 TaxID=2903573 RepID=UPI00224CF4E2|nr:SMP-30/gluconolactonase/LRE family protein [Kitasatospora sp. NBC_01287]MCX4744900.1 SMP-30/gluconolactonase/LRE family protein [Kitasatospora sp. NBC_01287]
MSTPRVEAVDDRVSLLGEGPVWDVRTGTLRWVDIPAGLVHSTDGSSTALPPPVAAVLPTSAGWAVVRADRIEDLATGATLARIPLGAADRCNDAKTDPTGRIWVGTMVSGEPDGRGALFRLDEDLTVRQVIAGATISNGLGWSPDGSRMYWIDTPTRRIELLDPALAIGAAPASALGATIARRTFAEVSAPGRPDGLAVDAAGAVWVALFDGSALHRYTPDGRLATVLPLPVSHPTSCAFGGPDLRTLYITTASRPPGATGATAGRLHAVRVPVPGLPPTEARIPRSRAFPAAE